MRSRNGQNTVQITDAKSALFHLLLLLDLKVKYAILPVTGYTECKCLASIMCNRIRDKEFNSNPAGGKVRRNNFCALLFRSGVYKYTDKNGWSINSEEMQNYLNQHGMKVGITLTKPRLKPRGGQQQTKRVKVWIISVLEKPLSHSSSIGSDFKKCIQIMKDSYPSYKSVLMHENRELNKMKRTSRNSGISSNIKRKQNDIVTTLDNEPPPLQHNRVSLESGALENTQLDESPIA